MSFEPATTKIEIGSIDEPKLTVKAQFNPKELQIDQNVPWKKPDAANKTGTQKGKDQSADDPIALEFTGAEGRTMTLELLFDGYESSDRGGTGAAIDVADKIETLATLARVRNPEEKDETKRRPHQCVVTWGATLPRFVCVIESLSIKYTMFSKDGAPLRATATVKLKEAHAVDKKKAQK
jgi:hypothetical protein